MDEFSDTNVIPHYSRKIILGKGGGYPVILVKHMESGTIHARKRPTKNEFLVSMPASNIPDDHRELTDEEIRLLHAIIHPLIVNLDYIVKEGNTLYMMMEYVQGGTYDQLQKAVGAMKDWQCRFYLGQLFDAMEYLHKRAIAYNDLKPENIMVDLQGQLRLVDFGHANRFTSDTRSYMNKRNPGITRKTKLECICRDIHEIRNLLIEMITNRSYHEIQEDPAGVILPLRVSDELRDIISRIDKMMGKCHPENTITELKIHPFFIVDLEMPEIETVITCIGENKQEIDGKDVLFYMKRVGSNGRPIWISKGFKDEYDWKMLRNKEVSAPVVPHPENPVNNSKVRKYLNIDGTELVRGTITRIQAKSKL